MSDIRPICVECKTRMNCEKNEVAVAYGEYKIHLGDMYQCPNCKRQIVIGLAPEAIDFMGNHEAREATLKHYDVVIRDVE